MNPVSYGEPTVHIWCDEMLDGRKFASDTEVQPCNNQPFVSGLDSSQHHS